MGTLGIHHRIALCACQIVPGNAFDTGYLALDREGKQPVEMSAEGVLTNESYYFVIPGLGTACWSAISTITGQLTC
jgi:hypothetical protein